MQGREKLVLLPLILVGMALIPVGDSAGKLLTQMGVEPAFVAWSRLVVGALVILPFSGLKLAEVKQLFNWRLLVRAGLFSSAIFCILNALKTEPIANVFGIFFIGPMVAYFLSVWLLKEKITLARSILLFIGFIGVLLVVKPGFGAGVGALFALAAGTFYGCMLVANRWLAGQFRPRLILLSTLCAGSLAMAPVAIDSIPAAVDSRLIMLVLISSIASALGNLMIIEANRRAEASIVAPFVYTQLIAATCLGVWLFSEWPDFYSMIGLAVIFISGILSFVIAKLPAAAKTSPTASTAKP